MAILRGPLAADHFTLVPNRWTRDPRLSWGAKGLLAYVAGHAVGYELTTAQMMREGNLGRDGLLTLVRELEAAGYLRRARQRGEGGRLGSYDYELTEPSAGQDHGGLGRAGAEQPEPESAQVGTSAAQATMAEAAHKEEHNFQKTTEEEHPPGGDAAAPPADEERPETAQDVVAAWIDYCTGQGIRLPKQVIGRYAREIKALIEQGYAVGLLKHALALMLKRGKASNPALLPSFVVEVQGSRPPEPSGNVRYDRRTTAERNDDRREELAEIAKIGDDLAAELGATGQDPIENQRISRKAREIWEARQKGVDLSTSCQATGYSGPDKAPIDAVWWPNDQRPREVTAT